MTHNLHILLGSKTEQNICILKQYLIKYGNEYRDDNGELANDYLQTMLLTDDNTLKVALHDKSEEDHFVSGLENTFRVELQTVHEAIANENLLRDAQNIFEKIRSKTVTLDKPGDGYLHVCVYAQLFDTECVNKAITLLNAIENTKQKFSVDFLLITPDLSHVYAIDEQSQLDENINKLKEISKENLQRIIDCKISNSFLTLNNVIIIQNQNEEGISLNLTIDSFTNLLGEYALTTTLDYNQIFHTTFLTESRQTTPITGLGFSMLNFDRYYFVQYLLHKAYKHILTREHIEQEEVDINKVSHIAQQILIRNIAIFGNIYNNKILPIINKNQAATQSSYGDVIAQFEPIINEEIDRVEQEFVSYFQDETLSLPEKRATLAQLLGEDDVLLKGILYNSDQLIAEECRRDVLDLFIGANNEILAVGNHKKSETQTTSEEGEHEPSEEEKLLQYAILSLESGDPQQMAGEWLREIKKRKNDIKTSTDYIRRQTSILEELNINIQEEAESHKCLTEEGFVFAGETYRLLPPNIERPLEETFTYSQERLPTEVDLRKDFTMIKNQGALGSCSAFAMVSIFEYFLKKNDGKEYDLSELFAYYNARILDNSTETEGTSLYNVIKGMGEKGICLEELCRYKDNEVETPSEEAYEEAKERKVNQALNVNCNIEDIKAAVAQGYPVAISMRIFDSFSTSTGFIPRPTDEERESKEEGWHAMVVCGYSEKEKIFIVRNSWGKEFGDNGYCYVPYSYMGDNELMRMACIITKISTVEIKQKGTPQGISVSFNQSDTKVQAAIIQTLIDEEHESLRHAENELKVLQNDYQNMIATLGRPNVRNTIREGYEKRLDIKLSKLDAEKQLLFIERTDELEKLDSRTNKLWMITGAVVAAVILVYSLIDYHFDVFGFAEWFTAFIGLGGLAFIASPFVSIINAKSVRDEFVEKYNHEVSLMWKIWGGVMALLIIAYIILSLYLIITPFPIGQPWLTIFPLMGYIPFLFMMLIRQQLSRDLDDAYLQRIEKKTKEIYECQCERNNIKTKMYIAGSILDHITSLLSHLNSKYYSIVSCVDNLKSWYTENESASKMEPINRQPFMSLIDNDCLDKYFDSHKEKLTKDIRLYQLFLQNYSIGENEITNFKKGLKSTLIQELYKSISDFSIFEYATNNRKYEYVNDSNSEFSALMRKLDCNSKIFIQVDSSVCVQSSESSYKMLFRHAPGNDGASRWKDAISESFSIEPQMCDLESNNKILLLNIEGLQVDQVRFLNIN